MLGFEPEYSINVATVSEEYEAIAETLSKIVYCALNRAASMPIVKKAQEKPHSEIN